MSRRSADGWAGYWRAGGAGNGAGCLSGAGPTIERALAGTWDELARGMRRGARILDLATGSGAVLRRLAAAKPGLRLTGVDLAPELPQTKGIKLKGGVAMERLPFRDSMFDALTSQFGVEYGDVAAVAREAARVAAAGALLRLVVHHAGSAVVRHNRARRDALAWAHRQSGVIKQARGVARVRIAAPLSTPPSFREAVVEAGRLFPDQTAAREFTAAVLQTLELGRGAPPQRTLDLLAALEERASAEIIRLNALGRAARDEQGIAELIAHFDQAGFTCDPPLTLDEQGRPFAWLVTGARRQSTES